MRFLSRHLGRFHWRIATNGTNDSSSTRRPRWCHGTATSVSQMGGDIQAISVRPQDPSSSSSGFNFFVNLILLTILLNTWQVNISRFQELDNVWHTDTLSRDEEQCLADSFNEFLEVTLKKVRQHRVLFPPLHRPSISKLDYLLRYAYLRKGNAVYPIFSQLEDNSFTNII